MKLSPGQAIAQYGHVVLPSLAAVVGLAAIGSQWIENHHLHGEVAKLNAEQATAVQTIQTQIKTEKEKSRTYVKDLNKWIDSMNLVIKIMNAKTKEVRGSAQTAINQRNAQNVAAMFQAGQAAGIEWRGATREALVSQVIAGQAPETGAFAGKTFRVPQLSPTDVAGLIKFVSYTPGEGLNYDRSGAQPGIPGVPTAAENEEEAAVVPPMPKLPES